MASPKNILLINPWIFDFTAYDFWMKPLGLMYVAALLKASGCFRLSFIDCLDRFHPAMIGPTLKEDDGRGPFLKKEVDKPEAVKAVPRRFSRYGLPVPVFEHELNSVPVPDAVLITCAMTYWYPGVQLAVDIVRRRFGSVPIILGGAYATLCPSHAECSSGADLVIRGPAERALFGALREALDDGLPPTAPDSPRLDDLPTPLFDLLRDRTWLPVLTSRGCPYRCTFCASGLLSDGFEQRHAPSVATEIAALFQRFGTRHFAFYDDALLVGKKNHIIPLLKRIEAFGLPMIFHTPNGLHVREIDRGLAGLFRRSGVRSLYLSMESSDSAWLIGKGEKDSAETLPRALESLSAAGFPRSSINVYVIMGVPGQGIPRVLESIRFVRSLGARPRVAIFSPIPGTAEWTTLVDEGVMTSDSDPLLHNKIAFACLKSESGREGLEAVSRLLAEGRSRPGRRTPFLD